MTAIRCLMSVILLTVGTSAYPQPAKAPQTFEIDGRQLLKARQDPAMMTAAQDEADKALHVGPFSVMQKSTTPPSGSKHDYMSLAPYFWPNPATPDHLPYVRRDGEHNPEVNAIPDHANIFKMESAVHALAIGYVLTGKEEYAARATLLLRTWFLNPDTCMNPNLQLAQGIRGVNTGRGIGVLEARGLPDVVDSIGMLNGSKSWTKADQEGMEKWFTTYFEWLTTSPHGRDESAAKNNHGSWYDVQAVGIALFLGKTDEAREILQTAKTKRIGLQIEPDGREPLELARTKSFGYSVFNLDALMRLADLGEHVGVDLWNYRAPDGGSIRIALDYMLPFVEQPQKWPDKNIEGLDPNGLRLPLLQAAVHFHDQKYSAAAAKLSGKNTLEVLLLLNRIKR